MENETSVRRVNMLDYDGACSILKWTGGRALGEEFEPYVMEIPGPDGSQLVKDGDRIEALPGGVFSVQNADSEGGAR